jgi:hypothetical protein
MTRPEFLAMIAAGAFSRSAQDSAFYLAENPAYSIRNSVEDSLRFTERCLVPYRGRLAAKSSFVDENGDVMDWHDFGPLEGPGWAANAVGGALELYQFGRFTGDAARQRTAIAVLDHVLEHGFIDASGIIKGYRHTGRNEFVLNFKHNNDWFCPGSMAKIGYQLLLFADALEDETRGKRMREAAVACAGWIGQHVKPAAGGWYPRRVRPDGTPYPWCAEQKTDDPLAGGSADGLFIIQLMTALTARRLADYRNTVRQQVHAFIRRGGVFGSINHDVYDDHENVAYAVAFRVLRQASALLGDDSIRRFAYDHCLAGLEQFKMAEDRHGVATKGLLYMCKSWDTAYLWESAEAALAYLEAYSDTRNGRYLRDGVTILRGIAKHHHGRYGFLTEGVDWNNHVSAKHHFDGAEFGDIRYTEPFLNNQHITEPTLFYLEKLGAPAV